MYRKIVRGAHAIYRKNKDDVLTLLGGRYPEFVYRRADRLCEGQIPIFAFHSVTPGLFEREMSFLAENNYRTLIGDELLDVLTGKIPPPKNAIVLTFDDGRGSLWSTAFPLLKKYGMKAVCFIVSHLIEDSNEHYPTLDEYWQGKASLSEIINRDAMRPLCTWNEILQMNQSGLIDFQSHTCYHHTVFISNRLIDFINPDFVPSFLNSDFSPVFRLNGNDQFLNSWKWGMPIYEYGPSMASGLRYVESSCLNRKCADWVMSMGGSSFFVFRGWRRELFAFFKEQVEVDRRKHRYQTKAERYNEVYDDLINSRRMIENRLNKAVRHLCLPWYKGSNMVVKASKEAGFSCIYWGTIGRRIVNVAGQNPSYLNRMNDEYLLTLPGKKSIALPELLALKAGRIIRKKTGFYSS